MNEVGEVALITGTSRGIGRAIAERLALEGVSVIANDYGADSADMEEALRAIKSHGTHVEFMEADVSDASSVTSMVKQANERFGRIDILVNNAGIPRGGMIDDLREADWDRALDVNLKGQFLVAQAVVPIMRAAGGGRIVNISSELALVGHANLIPYVSSKAGVIGLTKSLARELAPSIRVNCVAPGPTDTGILSDFERTPEYAATIPLGRLGQPAEIAAAVWFLVSHESSWTTGQVFSPNGGMVI